MEVVPVLELVKLELKKYTFGRYLLNAVIACFFITALLILVYYSSTVTDEIVFSGSKALFTASERLHRLTFLIFQSVLLGKIVIGEYKCRTVLSLYAYPIHRRILVGAKLLLIAVFIYLVFVMGNMVSNSLVLLTLRNAAIFAGQSPWLLLKQSFTLCAASALVTVVIGFIPLYFGMRKKSLATTIITGLLIGVLLDSEGIGSSSPLSDILAVNLVMILAGLVAIYLVLKNVEDEDVLV